MRTLICSFVLLGSAVGHAQNWALLNPAYKYNYANDGSDTISNQIFVTHIDTLGVDSFRYELNRIGSRCAPCAGVSSSCDTSSGVVTGTAQFLGGQLLWLGTDALLVGSDTLLIKPKAPVNASWPNPSGSTGTVLYATDTTILGQADSVKAVGYDDGRSLLISKNHGVIGFSDIQTGYVLIGVQGDLNAGVHYPEIIDFFDYQPGDVLQYHGSHGGTDGICVTDTWFKRKYTVLTRTELPGRTDYELRSVHHQVTISQTVWGPPNSWCTSSINEGIDTMLLGIEHSHCTPENFLANGWLTDHWPGAFASMQENTEQGEFGSSYHGFIWQAYLDDLGRTCLKPVQHTPDPGSWPATWQCEQDSSYWPFTYDEMKSLYTTGVGLTSALYFIFEHSGSMDLTGYQIGGQQWGTVLADDVILDIVEGSTATERLSIRQNPVSDLLEVDHAMIGSIYQVVNTNGSVVEGGRFRSSTAQIELTDLSDGLYILRNNGQPPLRFVVAH